MSALRLAKVTWTAGVLGFICLATVYNIVHRIRPRHETEVSNNFEAELPWCDRFGWSQMTESQCIAMTADHIPLVSGGTCPGAYEVWVYDEKKPPICVRRS